MSEKPFRPSHPAKTSKNSAGLDGCIGEVYLSRPDGEGSKTDPKIHPRLGPKNFTISAPKTAPAGYPLDMVMIGRKHSPTQTVHTSSTNANSKFPP